MKLRFANLEKSYDGLKEVLTPLNVGNIVSSPNFISSFDIDFICQ